jgi:hypothetical protein
MRQLLAVLLVLVGSYSLAGTAAPGNTSVPVKRVVLYDTGLAFIEHSGRISGSQELNFEFSSAQLDGVLKSITVFDSSGQPTGVRYDVPTTNPTPQIPPAPLPTNDIRHLTVTTHGKGERDITITYVLEAPVLRHSYRVVLQPGTPGKALLQGWVMVHNPTHSDWNNVQMSLVSGALPSLIKQSSQPEYFPKMGTPPCSQESVPGAPRFMSAMASRRTKRHGISCSWRVHSNSQNATTSCAMAEILPTVYRYLLSQASRCNIQ